MSVDVEGEEPSLKRKPRRSWSWRRDVLLLAQVIATAAAVVAAAKAG
ncbi:hypothetical protein ACFV3E_36815 [Streptomyces sp. NPDC059718]